MKKFTFTWAEVYVTFIVVMVLLATYLTFRFQPAKPQECPVAAYVHGATGCKLIPHGEK